MSRKKKDAKPRGNPMSLGKLYNRENLDPVFPTENERYNFIKIKPEENMSFTVTRNRITKTIKLKAGKEYVLMPTDRQMGDMLYRTMMNPEDQPLSILGRVLKHFFKD